jgi:muramoyltetrapeptide carboxypeptidase
MKKIIAPRLKIGDAIGIISPSSPILKENLLLLKKGVRVLSKMGFKIVFAKNYLANQKGYSDSITHKIADLHEMLLNKKVKAIIFSQGGDTANSILPSINYKLIRQHPKIFIGMSDNSLLLNAIHQKTGLITFHGNELIWGYGKNAGEYDKAEFMERLVNAKVGEINLRKPYKCIRSAESVRGKLLGGNLRCFMKLAATPYFPGVRGSILFFEACTITPVAAYAIFNQLKQMGVFKQIKAVIIGYIYSMQTDKDKTYQLEDILLDVAKEYSFPIFKINDAGHVCENTLLPIGAKIELDTINEKITILEKCVL